MPLPHSTKLDLWFRSTSWELKWKTKKPVHQICIELDKYSAKSCLHFWSVWGISWFLLVIIVVLFIWLTLKGQIHTYLPTYIHPYIHTYIHPSIHTYIHTYIQTERQTDRQTGRQTERQADRQTHTHTHTHTHRQTDIKMKNVQDLKISADSTDSLCTTNPQNRCKVRKTLFYYQVKAWIIF